MHDHKPGCVSCTTAGGLTNALEAALDEVIAQRIIDAAAQASGFTADDLLGDRRYPAVVYYRHLAMYLIRARTSLSLPALGRIFGRHHTTVMHAVTKIADEVIAERTGTLAAIARIDGALT